MSGLTRYLENELLDHTILGSAFTAPSSLWLALYTTEASDSSSGTEVSGNNYARLNARAGFTTAASGGMITNTATVQSNVASAAWGTITHVRMYDAVTAGNGLYHGALSESRAIAAGQRATFNPGTLIIRLT